MEPWSKTIKRRRLNWLGDIVKLNMNTPAIENIETALKGLIDKQVRPKATWLGTTQKDHEAVFINDLKKKEETTRKFTNVT